MRPYKIELYTVKRNPETKELEAISDSGHIIKHSEFAKYGMELHEGQVFAVEPPELREG